MFRGRYQHSMDAKGRVSIPQRYRELLRAKADERLVVTNLANCLVVYPFEVWRNVEEKVAQLPSMKGDLRSFQRFFISAATECTPDRQGRILIPPTLRDHAQLEKDVVFVGLVNSFEIWSQAKWDETLKESAANFENVANTLAELGL